MKICQQDPKGLDIQWASKILEVVKSQGDSFNAHEISELIRCYSDRKISVAVVGLNKRGKSTFCNAWLGRKDDLLAPIDWKPATCTISRFYQSTERSDADITYTLKNSSDVCQQTIPYEKIKSFAMEEFNQANDKNVECLSIYGQFDMDDNVVLLDLPGDDSIYAYHSQIVYHYLPHADVILFLSSATDPVTSSELKLLSKIKADQKIFFIINKADQCEPDELGQAISHNEKVLQNASISYVNRIYCISAKQVMESGKDDFDFKSLIDDIKTFLQEQKFDLQSKGFRRLVKEAASESLEKLELKDSARQLEKEELQKRIAGLKQDYAKIEAKLQTHLKKFSDEWEIMLVGFENKLPEIEKRSCQKVKEYISAISMFDFDKKTLESLPGPISKLMESELSIELVAMQEQIKNRLEQLDQSMKSIESFCSAQIYGYLQPVSSIDHHAGSFVAGGLMVGLGSTLATVATAPVAAFGSVPYIGAFLGGFGAVVTSPLMVLATPLFLGGALCLTFPVMGWLRGKKRQKNEILQQADNMVRQTFAAIRSQKIPLLKIQGENLVIRLKDSFTTEKKQILETLDEIEKQNNDSATEAKLLQQAKDESSLKLLTDLTREEAE